MIDITVKVPEDRVGEFYAMYGAWLSGEPAAPQVSAVPSREGEATERFHANRPWTRADAKLAAIVWGKLSDPARRLFSLLIDAPDEQFSGDALATMLGIDKGRHAIAGLLTWPGRYCVEVGRGYAWSWTYPDGENAIYWFTPEVADLFREARDRQA